MILERRIITTNNNYGARNTLTSVSIELLYIV